MEGTPITKRVLVFDHPYTCSKMFSSGSYWFRLEMAYGFRNLGWDTSLIQHPSYETFPWVKPLLLNELSGTTEVRSVLEDFDLILLLDDFKFPFNMQPRDSIIVYWDIEALPRNKDMLEKIKYDVCKNRENSNVGNPRNLQEKLKTYHFHFQKNRLRYWKPIKTFSVAKFPLLIDAQYLPMGAEPFLYKYRNISERDIDFAILGTTSRWFQAHNRIEIAHEILAELNYPLTYWFGAYPEIDQGKMPNNCYAVGLIDFFSLPYILQRIRRLLHIPRPYHLVSQGISATLFQALAAGALPFHLYKNNQGDIPGFSIEEFYHVSDETIPDYPKKWTYQARFTHLISTLQREGVL